METDNENETKNATTAEQDSSIVLDDGDVEDDIQVSSSWFFCLHELLKLHSPILIYIPNEFDDFEVY